MFTPLQQFGLNDATDADAVLNALSAQFQIRSEAETALRRIYYDSFDWRLYKAGALLECRESAPGYELIWRDISQGVIRTTRLRPKPSVRYWLQGPISRASSPHR